MVQLAQNEDKDVGIHIIWYTLFFITGLLTHLTAFNRGMMRSEAYQVRDKR